MANSNTGLADENRNGSFSIAFAKGFFDEDMIIIVYPSY